MTRPDLQGLCEELRLGARQRGSRHALAALMEGGVAAWMTLLSAGRRDAAHRGHVPARPSVPAERQEIVTVLTAMVIGHLQGANP